MAGKVAATVEAAPAAAAPAPASERLDLHEEKLADASQREAVHGVLQSPGDPLDPPTRVWAEARFGRSFSHVRVHAGSRSGESTESVESAAYTLGDHIVFGAGNYAPHTRGGRRLLAHELAHAVQQGSARPAGALSIGAPADRFEVEAESVQFRSAPSLSSLGEQRIQRVSWCEKINRFFGDEGVFEDDELQEYLKFLDDNKKIEDDFDSDNKAREVVRRWQARRAGYELSVPRKVLLLREMISGPTLDDDEKGMIAIVEGTSDAELTEIFNQITPKEMRDEIDGDNGQRFDELVARYRSRTYSRPDQRGKSTPPTSTQHLVTESVLNPGSTLEETPPPKEGDPAPPPVFKDAPAMTGTGVDGAFEKEMVAVMKTYLHNRGESFRNAKKKGKPSFPVTQANAIAIAAQKSTETYFAPYIQVASRTPSDEYHPGGKYSLTSQIHDQSQVPINDDGTNGHPGRIGWMGYWMSQTSSGGKAVMDKYNCVASRVPDKNDFARIQKATATDGALKEDIDDTIHGWPAEATGGVNIQPYRDMGSPDKARTERWDVFTTLIHEMMHILQHPNYGRTWALLGGTAKEILKEGMADVMRRDLWFGPGDLKKKVATSEFDNTREQIEGGKFDYDESVVYYHSDYPLADEAQKIVDGDGKRAGVGIENARAAFFLGHTDLLGIGEGTRANASLAGIGNYKASDADDAEIFVAKAGDSLESVLRLTNAQAGGVLDAATGNPIKPAEPFADGARLRVPGIRYVRAIQEDTLGSVAAQNGVEPMLLAVANRLGADTEVDHKFTAGERLLIPIHKK